MKKQNAKQTPQLPKAPTGISGLDELTGGGLPKGRPTLICGAAGAGKTLLAMDFLVRGAVQYDEPGVFVAFEEHADELMANFASLGHDLRALVRQKKLVLDFVRIEPGEIQETGAYDLEGLFIRLESAIDSIGAKRVVIDTVEALFAGLRDTATLRAELRRLFRWLKDKGVTAIITGERGEVSFTRFGLEEYVADCVILLDNRVVENVATRRLRIIKYRGTSHGTSEYPFLIDQGGISILPITSLKLECVAGTERVSSGILELDAMMGGRGYFRGSSVLVAGTAGSGKTSLAAHFVRAAAARGERCLWFAFEESPSQIIRNMRSIGIDLEPAVKQGRLKFCAERPPGVGLEMHLLNAHREVTTFRPQIAVLDPITNFTALGNTLEIKAMLTRLIDFFKMQQVTALFTTLTGSTGQLEATDSGVSSLMDTWLLLRDIENGGERNRVMYLLKSRGMAHSNQVREFLLTDHGIALREVYLGPSGALLTGSVRNIQETLEKSEALLRQQATESRQRNLARKRQAVAAQIAVLQAECDVEQTELQQGIDQDSLRAQVLALDRIQLGRQRQAEPAQKNRRHRKAA
jgi:circadian clock protein KaiC